ncbi:MAG: hypothetical protein ACK452_03035 [Bacteroidota bacterium]
MKIKTVPRVKIKIFLLQLIFLLIFVFVTTYGNSQNDYPYRIVKKEVNLSYVFEDSAPESKTQIKLYSNKTFEFLKFYKEKSIPLLKRSCGKYLIEGNFIRFYKDEKSKYEIKVPKKYYLSNDTNLLWLNKSSSPMKKIEVSFFSEPLYIDSVYGKIENYNIIGGNKIYRTNIVRVKKYSKIDSLGFNDGLVKIVPEILKTRLISKDSLKKIKVVVVIVDEFQPSLSYYEEKLFFRYLRSNGINYEILQYQSCTIDQLNKKCKDASILIYLDETMEHRYSHFINKEFKIENLGLKKNSIVIFDSNFNFNKTVKDGDKDMALKLARRFFKAGAASFMCIESPLLINNFIVPFFCGNTTQKIFELNLATQWPYIYGFGFSPYEYTVVQKERLKNEDILVETGSLAREEITKKVEDITLIVEKKIDLKPWFGIVITKTDVSINGLLKN